MLVPVRYVDLACPRCQSRHLCAPHECANTAGIHRFRAPGGLRAAGCARARQLPVWLPGDRPCEALGPNSQGGGSREPSQSASSDSLHAQIHIWRFCTVGTLEDRFTVNQTPFFKACRETLAQRRRSRESIRRTRRGLCSALGGFGLPFLSGNLRKLSEPGHGFGPETEAGGCGGPEKPGRKLGASGAEQKALSAAPGRALRRLRAALCAVSAVSARSCRLSACRSAAALLSPRGASVAAAGPLLSSRVALRRTERRRANKSARLARHTGHGSATLGCHADTLACSLPQGPKESVAWGLPAPFGLLRSRTAQRGKSPPAQGEPQDTTTGHDDDEDNNDGY